MVEVDNPVGDVDKAKDVALRLLGRRSYTRREIVRKLRGRQFRKQAIEDALQRLEQVGLVDDRTFSRSWVQERMRLRPMGRPRLFRELTRRGVEQEIVGQVLDEMMADVDPGEIAFDLLKSRRRRYEGLDRMQALSRMYGFLVRRGFDGSISRGASEQMWTEISDERR